MASTDVSIRLGYQIPNFSYGTPVSELFPTVIVQAREAEESSFDVVFVMDHFYPLPGIGSPDQPMLESCDAQPRHGHRRDRPGPPGGPRVAQLRRDAGGDRRRPQGARLDQGVDGVVVNIMGHGHVPGIVGSVGEALGALRS
jgi:hypothetical protein